ncbi:RluA family pseudouridine synthase [Zoogloea dura]|uniref:Dual-specificity RNA pseudouridine synthase RluA n=1 Tax=Zoogloea dura TaxID=2728840 RepID=A0A848G1C4_9RHOO|nr:RluA family pseudouridine synthase [Zoogloea dura]NML25998.1 RluA family pseudouridine synthase [Zoogloea dura]
MPHLNPTIVHVDEAVIVADKPAGLLSMPARGEARQDCLASRVQALYPDALLVHRLDMATSGLIMLARGHEMLRRLSLAFEQRIVGKKYCALVHGHVADDRGEIALALGSDPDNRPRQRVDPLQGRPALTRYRVLARSGEGAGARTRVELTPLTGRTHQLRVHLMSIGHPIVGDPLYAAPDEAQQEARMCLHAMSLAFIHPQTRVPACFESVVPF